jgi:hypothetical protein
VPANNSASVTLEVVDTGDVGDPGGGGVVPFLDVFPIYADVWFIDVNSWMKTVKNRVAQHTLRKDVEQRPIREISARSLALAPSTTLELNIGGIQRGRYVIIESTEVIQVSLGNTVDNFLPDGTFVFLGGGDFEKVTLKNNSATETASILIGVTD